MASARAILEDHGCLILIEKIANICPMLLCIPPSSMSILIDQIVGFLVPLIFLQCEKSGHAAGSVLWHACSLTVRRQILYLDVLLRDGLVCPVAEAIVGKGGAFILWKLPVPHTGRGCRDTNAHRVVKLAAIHLSYSCPIEIDLLNPIHHSGRAIWASFSNKAAPRAPVNGGSGGFTTHLRNVLSAAGLGLLIHDRIDDQGHSQGSSQGSNFVKRTMFIDEDSFTRCLAILAALRPHMPMPNAQWAAYWAAAKLMLV